MWSTHGHGRAAPFTPQLVDNWLYQVMGMTLSVVQELLGDKAAFTQRGLCIERVGGSNACGGALSASWGRVLGSRRDKAMIAWDYDVDLMVSITPSFDFGSLWRQAAEPHGTYGGPDVLS